MMHTLQACDPIIDGIAVQFVNHTAGSCFLFCSLKPRVLGSKAFDYFSRRGCSFHVPDMPVFNGW